MDIRRLARDAVADARSFGVAPTLRDLAYRAANRAVAMRILIGMAATPERINSALLEPKHFAVRVATRDELYAVAERPEWAAGLSKSFLEFALGRGDECIGVFDGPTLASTGWYSRLSTPISASMVLHFDAAWAYAYKGFTLPAYRGVHLHGIGKTFALAHCVERGARGLLSYVELNNLTSQYAMERAGYRAFGDLYLMRISGREICWSSRGCRPYQFRLESQAQAGGDAVGPSGHD